MKSLLIAVVAACALLTACQDSEGFHAAPPALNQINIRYVRDSRTNLCFAAYNSATDEGYIVTSLSTVPCEAVESFVGKP
jgi:hypothetical protein